MGPVRFWINDVLVEEEGLASNTTLLNYLRENRSLSGTKEGCAEGDCGACTVAVLENGGAPNARFMAVNSCLLLLPMMHGRRVYTVEGLRQGGDYHPVQTALAQAKGSQCGYCTPGIIMSMFEASYRQDLDAPWKLDDQLCGNLCRCTGYRPIREATQQIGGVRPAGPFLQRLQVPEDRSPELAYEADGQEFYAPRSWEALEEVLRAHPADRVRFVAGATDLGLDVTKRHESYECLIHVSHLPGMSEIRREGSAWSFGAAVSLADLEAATDADLPVMARMLRFFGARQIKNSGTLGGNICNASPIGDMPPVLLALGATLIVHSSAGEREIPMDQFFLGYRQTALKAGEVLKRIEVSAPPKDDLVGAYKVSKRRELDISAVCAAMRITLNEDGLVSEARLAYGGMAATPARAKTAEGLLVGAPWTEQNVQAAADALSQDFSPMDDHRGSAWYRATVARNLLLGFYEETRQAPYVHLPDRPACTIIVEQQP